MHSVTLHESIFYNGDCIRGAAECIPDGSVDLIISDPPYGIDGGRLHRHYNRNEDFVVEGYVEVPAAGYGEFSRRWISEAERVLRPGGSIYIVSGYTNLYHILHALRLTGLEEVNHIIWKYRFGVFTRRKYVSSHYHILFYEKPGGRRTFNLESRFGLAEKDKGGRSLNNADREDVWVINREYKPGQVKNKNELPMGLLVKMIEYSSNERDLICDFFLGGFSTVKAAIGLKRRATGFEISRPIFDAKVAEIRKVSPGFLITAGRKPCTGSPKNRGKTWSEEELDHLGEKFLQLTGKGMTRKEAVAEIGKEFGRGRWSIERALKVRQERQRRAGRTGRMQPHEDA
jgi:site-specific DNA-methyltransferase (adenine-specific)